MCNLKSVRVGLSSTAPSELHTLYIYLYVLPSPSLSSSLGALPKGIASKRKAVRQAERAVETSLGTWKTFAPPSFLEYLAMEKERRDAEHGLREIMLCGEVERAADSQLLRAPHQLAIRVQLPVPLRSRDVGSPPTSAFVRTTTPPSLHSSVTRRLRSRPTSMTDWSSCSSCSAATVSLPHSTRCPPHNSTAKMSSPCNTVVVSALAGSRRRRTSGFSASASSRSRMLRRCSTSHSGGVARCWRHTLNKSIIAS